MSAPDLSGIGLTHCESCLFNRGNRCFHEPPQPFMIMVQDLGGPRPEIISGCPPVNPDGFCAFGEPRPIVAD